MTTEKSAFRATAAVLACVLLLAGCRDVREAVERRFAFPADSL